MDEMTSNISINNDDVPAGIKKRIQVIGLEKKGAFRGVREVLNIKLTVRVGL